MWYKKKKTDAANTSTLKETTKKSKLQIELNHPDERNCFW